MIPTFLISNWRAIAVLVVIGGLGAGLLWYRGEAAQAEAKATQFESAYGILADKVRTQNAAVQDMEAKAAAAAETGRRARAEASGAMDVANRHAAALARAMAAARPVADCLPGEAVRVVRADLAQQ